MTALAFIALVALAAVYDVLTLAWHYARDASKIGRMVVIGCIMEVAAAVPLVLAISLGEWWPIGAGVVGSAIGTFIGAKRATANG